MANQPAQDVEDCDDGGADPIPMLKAGRQVGWIFKDGEAVAVERHECDYRVSEDAN